MSSPPRKDKKSRTAFLSYREILDNVEKTEAKTGISREVLQRAASKRSSDLDTFGKKLPKIVLD